ncbi:MAG: phospho-sugar mutase [Phycisphaerae bacterium]|nr:phospho-sugar mutase [Phycisphaerae bacterium]
MLDATVAAAAEAWLNDPAISEADKLGIRELRAAGNEKELTDRFYRDLEFGTGGLRGVIGAGTNRMNVYTVGAAAQGLANYVAKQGEAAKKAGVVIACDCRRKSDVFSRRVACVMAGNGIAAYLFDSLRPTPELSFAIRHLGCTAGVVVTASHNPPEYNGFKAYWTDGGQVVPPHDEAIIDEVRGVGGFANIRSADFDEARANGMIKIIGRDVDEAFLDLVQGSCLNPEACRTQGAKLKIVYTSLHGTGGVLIPEALKRRGFRHVIEVPEQAKPDGEFPTVDSPNPEEAAALNMAIDLARREGADLVIGTDPDADRVGIAVRRPDGEFELITGNRIGALLTHYICEQLTKDGKLPDNAVMITTIVSGDLMKEIARSYGAEVVETLTGFKWIGDKLRQYDTEGSPERPSKAFIFGAEESYGYMPAPFTRDKDAVTSTAFIAELAAVAASEGKGVYERLQGLFKRFGYFQEGAKSIVMKGKEGAKQIGALMDMLRGDPPKTIACRGVAACADIMTGVKKDLRTGEVIGRYDLPASNVLLFALEDGTKVIARPSGTEPKIKFYILVKEPADDLDKAHQAASNKIEAIIADLVRRADRLEG